MMARAMWAEPVGGREGFQEEIYGSKAELAKNKSRTAGRSLVVKGNLVPTSGVLSRENNRAKALSKSGELMK